jgi:hypothetical protein
MIAKTAKRAQWMIYVIQNATNEKGVVHLHLLGHPFHIPRFVQNELLHPAILVILEQVSIILKRVPALLFYRDLFDNCVRINVLPRPRAPVMVCK